MTSGPELQPGTRCECRDERCPRYPFEHSTTVGPCPSDAVRMVTVRLSRNHPDAHATIQGQSMRFDVPMCEPCADFAERAR